MGLPTERNVHVRLGRAVSGAVLVQFAACVAVAAVSGWLYRLGSGLRPVAVAAWAAPLPLLVLAPRVAWFAAVGVAAGAWLIGQLGFWSFHIRDVGIPRLLVAARLAGGCVGVASIVGLVRAHLVAGHLGLAALALPVAWVAMEFLVALRSPDGAWWSVAYSQADVPAVTQVASLTGSWGITALLALPSSVAAAVTAPAGTGGKRVAVLLAAAAIAAALTGYAVRRTRRAALGEQVHVGLAAVEQSGGPVQIDSPEGAVLVSRYVEKVRLLAARGAVVIVLPEVTFAVDEVRMVDQLQPLARVAVDLGVDVVVGVARLGETASANVAAVFGAGGDPPGVYQKHHLIPGLEAVYRPGRDLLYAPSDRRLGVLICKDLDFPRSFAPTGVAGRRCCWLRRGTSAVTVGCTAVWRSCEVWSRASRWRGLPVAAGPRSATRLAGSSSRPTPRRARQSMPGFHSPQPRLSTIDLETGSVGAAWQSLP
jgi:apolipoprotein N-acyltransferase